MGLFKKNKKEKSKAKQESKSKRKGSISIFSAIKEVIGGDVFLRDFFQRQFLLMLLLSLFALIYINNRFLYEKELRELEQMRKELADLKKKSITVTRDLKRSGRRSVILEELHRQGSELQENDSPVIIIDPE